MHDKTWLAYKENASVQNVLRHKLKTNAKSLADDDESTVKIDKAGGIRDIAFLGFIVDADDVNISVTYICR